jgi:tRNA (guanine-N7-)-methyltransferase
VARRKLPRFQYNAESENVVERGKEIYTTIKGKWKENYFKGSNPR